MWCGASPTNNGAADILLFWRCYCCVPMDLTPTPSYYTACSNGYRFVIVQNKFVQNFSYFCSSSTFLLAKDFSFLSDSRRRPKNPEPPARSSKRLAVGTRVEEISKKNLLSRKLATSQVQWDWTLGTENRRASFFGALRSKFVPNSFLIGQIQKFGRSRTKFLRLIKNFKSPGVV